jgi:hypothetical protein
LDGPGAHLTEDTMPVAAVVSLVAGILALAIGLHRWFGGDDRPPDAWLIVASFFVVLGVVRGRVIARGWTRLYGVLRIDVDAIGKSGSYRPPPDPRRTGRQQFIDRFSDHLDRSSERRPMSAADALGAILRRLLDLVVPLFALVPVLLGFPALDMVGYGAFSCAVGIGRLKARGERAGASAG